MFYPIFQDLLLIALAVFTVCRCVRACSAVLKVKKRKVQYRSARTPSTRRNAQKYPKNAQFCTACTIHEHVRKPAANPTRSSVADIIMTGYFQLVAKKANTACSITAVFPSPHSSRARSRRVAAVAEYEVFEV